MAMPNRTKIVFIGATSMSFGLSMLRDIFSSDELRGSTLTLVGRNAQTLGKMTELAKLLNAKMGAGLIVEQTTDRRAAFDCGGLRPQPSVEAGLRSAAQIRHPPHAR
jgi:alpha-galactosidase